MFNFFKKSIDINEGYQQFLNDPDGLLVDVRTPEEYQSGHLPNSINVVLSAVNDYQFDTSKKLYLYCRSGSRSGNALNILKARGYDCVNIGGIMNYQGKVER